MIISNYFTTKIKLRGKLYPGPMSLTEEFLCESLGRFLKIFLKWFLIVIRLLRGAVDKKKKSVNAGDARDTVLIPWLGRSPGGGNSNPSQYSCLENSMDRGAWQVYGVTKSQTQLSTYVHTRCTYKIYNLNYFKCAVHKCIHTHWLLHIQSPELFCFGFQNWKSTPIKHLFILPSP